MGELRRTTSNHGWLTLQLTKNGYLKSIMSNYVKALTEKWIKSGIFDENKGWRRHGSKKTFSRTKWIEIWDFWQQYGPKLQVCDKNVDQNVTVLMDTNAKTVSHDSVEHVSHVLSKLLSQVFVVFLSCVFWSNQGLKNGWIVSITSKRE